MRWMIMLAAVLMVSVAGAGEKKMSEPVGAAAGELGKPKPPPAVKPILTEEMELSSNECENLQCDLVVMRGCDTNVGCNCHRGVTICVDEMSPE